MSSIILQSGLMSSPKNMKEACQAMIDARRNRARGHRLKHSHEKLCSGLTDNEWNAVVTRQKTSFAKGKSFAYTARWNDYKVNYKTNKL
jgi:hypothetical protein